MNLTGWIDDRLHDITDLQSGAWLAIAAWVAVGLGVVALIYARGRTRRAQAQAAEGTQPNVVMSMEPHGTDWHLIEIVAKNYGQRPAYDVSFEFDQVPTVAQYEHVYPDGSMDVVEILLPDELPILASGQEWRTPWDSALDRAGLRGSIESRFEGTVYYYAEPAVEGAWKRLRHRRQQLQSPVLLDWDTLQPLERLELMTNGDLAKREKNKLELLRSLLTYFHYAAQETRQDVFRSEIDRINQATVETQDRWRNRHFDRRHEPRSDCADDDETTGRHHRQAG